MKQPRSGEIELLCNEVNNEVRRACQLFSPIYSLHEGMAVISEEMDEFWELVKQNPNKLTEQDKQQRILRLRKELIQVAAMAVRTALDMELNVELDSLGGTDEKKCRN